MSDTKAGRILLVEDEPHLAFNLQLNLKSQGYRVDHADSGSEALSLFRNSGPYDLIILDVMIPEPNGFDVARQIRLKDAEIGILMLTARVSDTDKLTGLEIGVDDYIAKPFKLEELLLKVKRAATRSGLFSREKIGTSSGAVLELNSIKLDTQSLELCTPNGEFELTALEAELLCEFMKNPNKVLSREHLLNKVWGVKAHHETRTVDNFVMRLRKYLEKKAADPKVLASVRGRGYRFNPEMVHAD